MITTKEHKKRDEVNKLIALNAELISKALKISAKVKIYWWVLHTKNVNTHKVFIGRQKPIKRPYAVSYLGENLADIVIFYDQTENAKHTIGTIIHELLHVKFKSIRGSLIHTKKSLVAEEKVVVDLEAALLDPPIYKYTS